MISIHNSILLTKVNVQQAAETLASAFEDFPFFAFVLPKKVKRKKQLMALFEFLIRYGLKYGRVYVTANFEGTAIWLNYEKMKTSVIAYLRFGIFKLLRKLGLKNSLKLLKIDNFTLELHEKKMSEPHWFLQFLGVHPDHQRKGYGSFLVNEMLKLTKHERRPYWVDTQKEENVAFFQKFGFELVEVAEIPESDMKHWCMIKKVS